MTLKAPGSSAALLTTCHLDRDGLSDVLRLVASVQIAIDKGEIESLRHVILLQGCNSTQRKKLSDRFPPWVELFNTPENLSSPAARNLLIRHLLDGNQFDPHGFVAFPDDDAWYPQGSLKCVSKHFQGADELRLIVTGYGPHPTAKNCNQIFRASLQRALKSGACATIFMRGDLLAELAGFQELLGLGTKLRGGEDTELVHRAFHRARGKVGVIRGVLVGHALADPKLKAQYYEGALAALMAHRKNSGAAQLAFVRKIAVGVWLVFRGRLRPSEYIDALRKARAHAPLMRVGPDTAKR